jgi:hypothetical protein
VSAPPDRREVCARLSEIALGLSAAVNPPNNVSHRDLVRVCEAAARAIDKVADDIAADRPDYLPQP